MTEPSLDISPEGVRLQPYSICVEAQDMSVFSLFFFQSFSENRVDFVWFSFKTPPPPCLSARLDRRPPSASGPRDRAGLRPDWLRRGPRDRAALQGLPCTGGTRGACDVRRHHRDARGKVWRIRSMMVHDKLIFWDCMRCAYCIVCRGHITKESTEIMTYAQNHRS